MDAEKPFAVEECKFENLLGKMQVKENESYICGNICTGEWRWSGRKKINRSILELIK